MNCNTTHYRANSSSVPGDPTSVAEAHATLAYDRDAATLAADRAEELAVSHVERAEVVLARYLWCGARTNLVPSRPRRPDEMLRRGARMLGWDRDANALFDHLRLRVDRARLETIARNDYGFHATENLAELTELCLTGNVPRPIWTTLEVLQLERWTDAYQPECDHVARALCCALLLLDEAAGGSGVNEGNESTLVILVESCLQLGDPVVDHAIAFLAALADTFAADANLALFVELALVLLAARRDPDDPRLDLSLARLDAGARHPRRVTSEWILGLTHYDTRHALWRQLCYEVPALAARLSGGIPA